MVLNKECKLKNQGVGTFNLVFNYEGYFYAINIMNNHIIAEKTIVN